MSDHCYCSPCELARFRTWLRRAETAADDEAERQIALDIIADISRGRAEEGIAEDLVLAAAALLVGEKADASAHLRGCVDAEVESQRLNPSERVCPRAGKRRRTR